MSTKEFNYTREWTDAEAFPLLSFTKNWENPDDYPTIETDEQKVRQDMQSLHDEVKDFLNNELIPRVIAEDATVAAWQAQEDAHAEAEAGRVLAEEGRVLAEQNRKTAEAEREQTIAKVENLTATAVSLPQNSEATAEIITDPETGAYILNLGIPKGRDGEGIGNMSQSVYDPTGKAQDIFAYAVPASSKGSPDGVASLDGEGKVPKGQLPEISSVKVYEATIGTAWTENEDTGVKTQTVSIEGITAENTAKVDHSSASVDGTSDGYATFVEEENQYLTYITNGFAETVAGGIKFTIFGDAPTVSIPIVVEVV